MHSVSAPSSALGAEYDRGGKAMYVERVLIHPSALRRVSRSSASRGDAKTVLHTDLSLTTHP